MTAEYDYGQDKWVKCRNDYQDLTVKFTPTVFFFQNEYKEISKYRCEIVAIKDLDEYFREAGRFRNLGVTGDYYLKFAPNWDFIGDLLEYVLISKTELIIPVARNGMYKMKKVEEYIHSGDETDYLSVIPNHSICYGNWKAMPVRRHRG